MSALDAVDGIHQRYKGIDGDFGTRSRIGPQIGMSLVGCCAGQLNDHHFESSSPSMKAMVRSVKESGGAVSGR